MSSQRLVPALHIQWSFTAQIEYPVWCGDRETVFSESGISSSQERVGQFYGTQRVDVLWCFEVVECWGFQDHPTSFPVLHFVALMDPYVGNAMVIVMVMRLPMIDSHGGGDSHGRGDDADADGLVMLMVM